MADIELVVKIPKEAYNSLSTLDDTFLSGAEMILKHGTTLPKGHGRLIDADALRNDWFFGAREKIEIDNAPTIIEADKESEDT